MFVENLHHQHPQQPLQHHHHLIALVPVAHPNGKETTIVMMITTIVDVVGMAVIVVDQMLTNLTVRNANVLTQKPKPKCC